MFVQASITESLGWTLLVSCPKTAVNEALSKVCGEDICEREKARSMK